MRRFWHTGWLVSAVTAMLALSVAACQSSETPSEEPPPALSETVERALVEFGQRVKLPRYIPFDVKAQLASTNELMDGQKILHVDFIGEQDWLTITVQPGKSVSLGGELDITRIRLANGIRAEYTDNGTVQALVWADGGLLYSLSAGGTHRTAGDLALIAESFR